MSKNWMVLTGLLFLGYAGASQAHPLDTPDVVYIDGLPCNSACQTYMGWSRRKSPAVTEQSAPVEPPPAESPAVQHVPEKPVPRSAPGAVHPSQAARREDSKPAAPRVAKQAVPLPSAGIARPQPAGDAVVNARPAPTEIAVAPPAAGAVAPPAAKTVTRTVQEQVAAATALADNVTAASAETSAQGAAAGRPGDSGPKAAAATDSSDNLVALVMARKEIASVSDLAGKEIAIGNQQSASSASIQAAIASAGAAEVRLDEKNIKAVDRLIGGEVPAAVLALVSPQAAEWFPDIPGYRIFRIPLSPGSARARL